MTHSNTSSIDQPSAQLPPALDTQITADHSSAPWRATKSRPIQWLASKPIVAGLVTFCMTTSLVVPLTESLSIRRPITGITGIASGFCAAGLAYVASRAGRN